MRLKLMMTGAAAGAALILAGCSGGDDSSTPTMPSGGGTTATAAPTVAPTATMAPEEMTLASATGAASLRAGLTALLQEHVYLAGAATHAALTGGDFDGAAAALDGNSQSLAGAIGSVYGDAAGSAFLELWRTHIGFFVEYTVGTAEGDEAKVAAAVEALDQYRTDFGAFLAAANPNFTVEAVAEELIPHTATVFAFIDAQAAGSADQWRLMREAASHMPHTAAVLAGGIAAQMPEMFDGDVNSAGADLRAGLTALLQEHVFLAAFATGEALRGESLDGPAAELDANSQALAGAIGSLYGEGAGAAFLELWRTHIGFFVDYTVGTAEGDAAKVAAAEAALDGYRTDFGAFMAAANPNFTVDGIADALVGHVATLFAVIDAQAAGDTSQWVALRDAAEHMPHTAAALADGIVAQMPELFASASGGTGSGTSSMSSGRTANHQH